MKKAVRFVIPASALLLFPITGASQFSYTFAYTGSMQTFTIPACVSSVTVDLRGAAGANALDKLTTNSTGGMGGRATGVLTVTPGQVLNIFVGGAGNTSGAGGYNGGGAGGSSSPGSSCQGGPAGGGGGASDIRIGGVAYTDRVVVAGGGGGAGRDYCNGSCQPCGCGGSGGGGGGLTGIPGQPANNCGYGYPGFNTNGGSPGSSSSPGPGGFGDNGGTNGGAGGLGTGGQGSGGNYDVAGGGGGGGYYGGGGGGGASSGSGVGGGGGGGGSSFVSGPGMSSGTTQSGVHQGNGIVSITYSVDGGQAFISPSSPTICNGNGVTLTAGGGVTYTWTNPSSGSQAVLVNPGVSTIYSVSATNSLGCVTSATVPVTVQYSSISVSASSNSVCMGQSVMLTASGANSYTWSNSVSNAQAFYPSATNIYTVSATNACGIFNNILSVTVTPIPVNTSATPSVACQYKPVVLSATAAASGFTWYPMSQTGASVIATPSANIQYSVSVTDGTCIGTGVTSVSVNPNPTVFLGTGVLTVCAGYQVTLTATGANNYTWSEGSSTGPTSVFTPTQPTLYTVTGFNQFGCHHTANMAVLTAAAPSFSIVASHATVCLGGTSTLTASGDPSFYNWSTGDNVPTVTVQPTSATVYTVIGSSSSNTCTGTRTIQIGVFQPTVQLTVSSASICPGGSATLTSGQAASYNWHGAGNGPQIVVTPTSNTNYTLTTVSSLGNLNCSLTQTTSVKLFPAVSVSVAATRTAICRNESIVVTADGASTYTWVQGNTNGAAKTFSSTVTGSFTLTVNATDVNGCKGTGSQRISVTACNSISETSSSGISVYPNPAQGALFIENQQQLKIRYRLVDQAGRLISEGETDARSHEIKLNIASGVYFLHMRGDGIERTERIVKE